MKIAVINNIFTPYRTFLFDFMSDFFKSQGHELTVFYQFEKEKERHWDTEQNTFKHNYYVSKNRISLKGDFYSFFSFNIDFLKHKFSDFDYVIFSPLMSVNNILLSYLIPKRKQIHWIESNFESTKFVGGPAKYIKKYALGQASKYLVPSEKSIDYIRAFQCRPDSDFIKFPNLIDFNKYYEPKVSHKKNIDIRNMLQVNNDTKCILVVGELCHRKGSDRLIDILKNVEGNYKIIVLGTGVLHEELVNQVNELNMSHKIAFLGHLEQSESLNYFQFCDCFLHLARRDPAPLVCVEAVTSGLIMAVSNSTGNSKEVVGSLGFTFDVDSDDELFDVVRRLVHLSEDDMLKASACSKLLAKSNFTPDIVIKRLLDRLVS
ncbi:hypothetical protein VCHA48O428_90023 [Vibrio chagasii]|nr:hypothetical protein VCHA48O428_90023 [Vibrio chagasii]